MLIKKPSYYQDNVWSYNFDRTIHSKGQIRNYYYSYCSFGWIAATPCVVVLRKYLHEQQLGYL